MFLSNLFLALLAAPPVPVLADKCDAAIPGPLSDNARASLQRLSKKQAQPPPPTPLYVHIVAGSKDRKDGYLSVCPLPFSQFLSMHHSAHLAEILIYIPGNRSRIPNLAHPNRFSPLQHNFPTHPLYAKLGCKRQLVRI